MSDSVIKAAVSERLSLETGILAGRLARFLVTALPSSDNALQSGVGFLQAFFESVAGGRPLESFSHNPLDRAPAGEKHPLDRLTHSLSLTPEEIELLLLAGLSEEHEGLAALLRSLHPHAESRATAGLAAQLLHGDLTNRRVFRNTIQSSVLLKSRALLLTGDGPLFERSLQLAEGLWSVLHGIDVWPSAVRTPEATGATVGLEEWFETAPAKRALLALSSSEPCTIVIANENEETAFHRALALVTHAGADPAGILLPAAIDPAL